MVDLRGGLRLCLILSAASCVLGLVAAQELPRNPAPLLAGDAPPAQTIVQYSTSELLRTHPELRKLQLDEDQSILPSLLDKVGSQVERLFLDFPNTSSIEDVRSDVLSRSGSVLRSTGRKFQYLMIARTVDSTAARVGGRDPGTEAPRSSVLVGRGVMIEEFRTDLKGRDADISDWAGAYMLTQRFASIPLFFHPLYKDELVTRYLGREAGRGNEYVIAFAQKPESASIRGSYHSVTGEIIAFYVQGIAWVDPQDFEIVRIRTELLPGRTCADLLETTTDVELEEMSFPQLDRTLRMPHRVQVQVRRAGQIFVRNLHRYSDYRLFSVQSIDSRPEIRKP